MSDETICVVCLERESVTTDKLCDECDSAWYARRGVTSAFGWIANRAREFERKRWEAKQSKPA